MHGMPWYQKGGPFLGTNIIYAHMHIQISMKIPKMKSKALCTSPTVDIWFSRSLRNGSWLTVEESPIIARCLRALVTATLLLRCSDKNPTSPILTNTANLHTIYLYSTYSTCTVKGSMKW